MSLALIFAISMAEIIGDTEFKFYARSGNPMNFTLGIAGYAAVIYFLIKSLKVANILYVNGMWDGMSALLETLFAIIILKETLNTQYQYIGIALIVAGIYLLHMGGIKK
jgi:multidrug transporter EmrE-like cation transporter